MQGPVHDPARGQPRRGSLVRAMEQREEGRRVQEAARLELERFYSSYPVLQHLDKSVLLDDVKRQGRQAKERALEAQLLDGVYQSERARELATIRAGEEERLCAALERQERDKAVREKEIQQLREQSVELRQLAGMIRTAKVSQGRAVQLQQKAELKQQADEQEQRMNQYLHQVAAVADARQHEADVRKRDQAVQASRVQLEQMQEKQDALRVSDEEHRRERAMVDEVLRRIHEEDAAEERVRRLKQEETKAMIRQFIEDRDALRRAEIRADQDQDRRDQEHWGRLREREAVEALRKAEARKAADRLYEQVRREVEAQRRRLEEEEAQIDLLRQEEYEVKRREEEAIQRRKAERMRMDIRQANEEMRRQREQREAAYLVEEEQYRRQLMAQFAEADRVEQMNQQKRRMKVLEHQRQVQAMIDDKRRLFEEHKAREEAEVAAGRAEDERKLALVESERRRLLAEAAALKDFLPPGALRHQGDVEWINQVLREQAMGR